MGKITDTVLIHLNAVLQLRRSFKGGSHFALSIIPAQLSFILKLTAYLKLKSCHNLRTVSQYMMPASPICRLYRDFLTRCHKMRYCSELLSVHELVERSDKQIY